MKPYSCGLCSYSTKYKSHIKSHELLPHKHKCEKCDFKGVSRNGLDRHILDIHKDQRPYKCDLCEYASDRKSSLKIHVQSRHTNENPYKCDLCEHSCVLKKDLNTGTQAL